MGSAGEAAENWVLDGLLGDNHIASVPDVMYMGLFTEVPTDGGGGIEVASTGNNYYRAMVLNDSDNWPDAAGSVKSNGQIVQFPNALDPWGTIVAWALFDALEGGNLVVYGELDMQRVINSGTAPYFEVGDLTITAD